MKIKVVKGDPMAKSPNRANLVKVSVQVNGRTGQYSSHRWKNPMKALEILKEGLKSLGIQAGDTLVFTDKKTKKTYSEEGLIREYQRSKTNDTIQSYVKKNYTVKKQKESKQEGKKEGKKKHRTLYMVRIPNRNPPPIAATI